MNIYNSKSALHVIFSSLAIIIAVLGLIGYIPGFDILGRVNSDFIPMAHSTAVSFILLSVAVLFYENIKQNKVLFWLAFIIIIIVTVFGLLEVPGHLLNLDLNLENLFVPNYGLHGNVPIARMSPSTGFFFFIIGISLLLLFLVKTKNLEKILLNTSSFFMFIALLGSIIFLLGYMHETPLMYNTQTIPMALTTAVCFLFLISASILILDKDCFIHKLFSGDSTRAKLIRIFLPISVIAVILGEIVNDFIVYYLPVHHVVTAPLLIVIVSLIVGILTFKFSNKIGNEIDFFHKKINDAEEISRNLAKLPSENPYPVLRIGKDKNILYANEAVAKILIEENMTIGSPFNRWHNLIDKAFTSGIIQDVAETNENDKFYSWKLVPVDKYSYINIYGMDITERKLSERKLRQSQKMEAVGQLATGIAHDFNNILTIIMGNSQILEKRLENIQKNDKALANLKGINLATTRASDLTKQLLVFGRKDIARVKEVNINTVITDLLIILDKIITENITISMHLSENIKPITADKTQIEQVIMNLVINAKDAMPDGGKLTIETCNIDLNDEYEIKYPFESTGHHIQLKISDTGCGMSSEIKEKIFDPFFTTKPKGVGTGLGLSTVYGIIKKHSGNIFVYSEEEKGTSFKIYLPISKINKDNTNELEKVETYHKKNEDFTATVLVVDDSDGILKIIKEQLNGAGYTVLLANDGNLALQIAKDNNYNIDLLLTDVIMPKISGKELYDSLVLNKPELKVIYMSGYTSNVIAHHGVIDEKTNFLEKPFKPKDLLDIVSKICSSTLS